MKHFPIYLKVADKRICIIGNDDDGVAKARLVAKSEALIEIYSAAPDAALTRYLADYLAKDIEESGSSSDDRLRHYNRSFVQDDITDASRPPIAFVYLTKADEALIALMQASHIPYCVIDNLAESSFTTPAIIDRAPLVIAIGTEGTAPVLARRLKQELEERLPQSYGALARVAGRLRNLVGSALSAPHRRHFWARYFEGADEMMSDDTAHARAISLLDDMRSAAHHSKPSPVLPRPVWFVSAGPGDPDLMTMQARHILHDADVILYDKLVAAPILELCRREAQLIAVGKTGFGPSWRQGDINKLLIEKAQENLRVVRLKSGDATIFGRLDEEIAALHSYDIAFRVAPGLTSASAGAAIMGASLTKRGRNTGCRIITGHDVNGYADYDWHEMAKGLQQNAFTACVYMSVRAAPYLAGRLLRHGAPHDTVITVAENISRSDEGWLVTTLGKLSYDIVQAGITGPAIIYMALTPHEARLPDLHQMTVPEMTVPEMAVPDMAVPEMAVPKNPETPEVTAARLQPRYLQMRALQTAGIEEQGYVTDQA